MSEILAREKILIAMHCLEIGMLLGLIVSK